MTDTFGETLDEKNSKFKKTVYFSTKPGEYVIRILDSMETKKFVHSLGRAFVECLGEDCPICQNNKKILYEHPEDYKDVSGWCPRRSRFWLNILDKADGIVKVLSCGPQLIEDLKTMSKSIRNEQDERIDIRHYDWTLTVKGTGLDKETTPSHRFFGKETEPEIGDQTLYDLDNCIIKLTPEEMLDVFNGASLKDVFDLRKAKKAIQDSDSELASEVRAEIKSAVDEVFGE